MVLNNKGQVMFYMLMLAVTVIILALALVAVVKIQVDTAREPTTDTNVGLDCNNSSISDYQKGQCFITDVTTPYFFFGLIAIALLVAGAKALST